MKTTTPLSGPFAAIVSALVLSTAPLACGNSAMTGAFDAPIAAPDASNGGTSGGGGGSGGLASDGPSAGGGAKGVGGVTSAGGIVGAGGSQAAGGAPGTGGATRGTGGTTSATGGRGAGGVAATGGRQGTGGRLGTGGITSADGGADAAGLCPAQIPFSAIACQGPLTCTYGSASCCGQSSSAWTCVCTGGTFFCSQTVECNIICPTLDGAVGGDGSADVGISRDAATDAPGVGAACATTEPRCAGDAYCDWSDNRCGTLSGGTCAAIPRGVACIVSPAPVCGCDGQNYPGSCQAAQAGVDVSSNASCPAPAGMFRCGWTYCRHNQEYCNAVVGGAVSNPGSYSCTALPAACGGTASCACVGSSGPLCSTSAQGDVTVTLPVP